jgi:uncharacterized protein (DUF58 family)
VRRSESWGRFALLLLVAGYLLMRSGFLAVAGLMLTIQVIALLWNRTALRGFHYRRRFHYRRAFPGEKVPVEIRVENRKRLPLAWLRTTDHWPTSIAPEDERLLQPSHLPGEGLMVLLLVMRGFERMRRKIDVIYRRRGVFTVGPASAQSGDPFGLYRSEALAQGEERIVVFPEVWALDDVGIRPDDPFGERRSPRRLFEDPTQVEGIRDYQPGDNLRRVHWQATARVGRLQSKVHQPVAGLDLVVCLNAATFERHWEGTDPELLEAMVSMAASLASEGYQRGYRVGLISNGSISHSDRPFSLPPGRSREQLPRILEALAGLVPIVTVPFERYLLSQAPRLEYGSTLLVVTAVVPSPLVEVLLRLKARCRRASLVSLASTAPPAIPGVEVIHRPAEHLRSAA